MKIMEEELKRIANAFEKIAQELKDANYLKRKELQQKGVIPGPGGHY